MCDFGQPHSHPTDFGFLVDVPEIRALVETTRQLTRDIPDTAARVDALRPAFGKLLAADGWLPKEYGEPDLTSGMGSGIGQYALYRAEDGHADHRYPFTSSPTTPPVSPVTASTRSRASSRRSARATAMRNAPNDDFRISRSRDFEIWVSNLTIG